MREDKEEARPTVAAAERADANETIYSLSENPLNVNDLLRCREIREQTGMMAKDTAAIIQKRFPKFNRQLLAACENPEQYGVLIHPDGLWFFMGRCGTALPPASAQDEPPLVPASKLTQCDRVLRHMRDYGSITSLEAMKEYGIMRLASRISDLKRKGYAIVTQTETGKNRYGEKTSYARYSLTKEADGTDG